MCEVLPIPEFNPLPGCIEDPHISYLLCISDPHYGARFRSTNNEYSSEIFKDRLENLAGDVQVFVQKKNIHKLYVACLGDTIQGILRASDLKLNDTAVVKSVVEISRLLAQFLSSLSQYVLIEYYHVPSANHTQIRPLGTKANEIADEDLEYVIGNYIKDLCSNNPRISVNLADENDQCIKIGIPGFDAYAMHGHQIKDLNHAISNLSMMKRTPVDYLILGHYHSATTRTHSEGITYDTEVIICPSIVGSDPYSDSLMKGGKAAANIYGFDEIYGHTETYKFILN